MIWLHRSLGVDAPPFKTRRHDDVMVAMRDGAHLRTRRFAPKGEARGPGLLVRSPYGIDNLPTALLARFFAGYGYQVVLQDTRGRYGSEGQFYPFVHEAPDGGDTLRWIGEQPWFNGALAMFGPSYLGYTQWSVAAGAPEFLKAIVPIVTTTDFYRLFYPGGAFSLISSLRWASTNGDRRGVRSRERRLPGAARERPLRSAVGRVGREAPFYADWVDHPERDSYWQEIDHPDGLGTTAAVFNIAGTYDIFCGPQLADHAALVTRAAPTHLMIGPYAHGTRALSPRKLGWQDAGLAQLLAPTLRFLERELRGDNRALPAVSRYVQGANAWVQEDSWPPRGARATAWFLTASGRLLPEPAEDGELSYSYDPADPVPSRGGTILGPKVGPADQRDLAERADVLTFDSPPLAADCHIAGPVRALLHVESSAPATDFTCKLVHLPADSRAPALNLCDGIERLPSAPDPDQPVSVDLWHQSVRIPAGDRLRVEVSSSNFPRYDAHPNEPGNPGLATCQRIASQRLYCGHSRPSRVEIHMLD